MREERESGLVVPTVDPSSASLKSGLQVMELEGLLYLTKMEIIDCDGLTGVV